MGFNSKIKGAAFRTPINVRLNFWFVVEHNFDLDIPLFFFVTNDIKLMIIFFYKFFLPELPAPQNMMGCSSPSSYVNPVLLYVMV